MSGFRIAETCFRMARASQVLLGFAVFAASMPALATGTCKVQVFIDSIRMVTATDAPGQSGPPDDFTSWDKPFVAVNKRTNNVDANVTGFNTDPTQLEENQTDDTDRLIFDDIVGSKGQRVHIFVVLSNKEIDNADPNTGGVGGKSDEGFGSHSETLVERCANIAGGRNFVVPVTVTQMTKPGFAKDANDKGNGINGLIEVRIHVEIDP